MTAAVAAKQLISPPSPEAQTSKDAAISIAHTRPKYLTRILDVIKQSGKRGATTDGIVDATGLKRSTVSARIADLIHAGRVVSSPTLVGTSNAGRAVSVWLAVPEKTDADA